MLMRRDTASDRFPSTAEKRLRTCLPDRELSGMVRMEKELGHQDPDQRGPPMVTQHRLLPASLEQEDQADPEDQEARADQTDLKEMEKEIPESPVRDQAVGLIEGLIEGPVVEARMAIWPPRRSRRRWSLRTEWTQ